jgi:hypothetical protein
VQVAVASAIRRHAIATAGAGGRRPARFRGTAGLLAGLFVLRLSQSQAHNRVPRTSHSHSTSSSHVHLAPIMLASKALLAQHRERRVSVSPPCVLHGVGARRRHGGGGEASEEGERIQVHGDGAPGEGALEGDADEATGEGLDPDRGEG